MYADPWKISCGCAGVADDVALGWINHQEDDGLERQDEEFQNEHAKGCQHMSVVNLIDLFPVFYASSCISFSNTSGVLSSCKAPTFQQLLLLLLMVLQWLCCCYIDAFFMGVKVLLMLVGDHLAVAVADAVAIAEVVATVAAAVCRCRRRLLLLLLSLWLLLSKESHPRTPKMLTRVASVTSYARRMS